MHPHQSLEIGEAEITVVDAQRLLTLQTVNEKVALRGSDFSRNRRRHTQCHVQAHISAGIGQGVQVGFQKVTAGLFHQFELDLARKLFGFLIAAGADDLFDDRIHREWIGAADRDVSAPVDEHEVRLSLHALRQRLSVGEGIQEGIRPLLFVRVDAQVGSPVPPGPKHDPGDHRAQHQDQQQKDNLTAGEERRRNRLRTHRRFR